MTTLTCTRRVHFSAGHRVMNHESKCATVHGHNYYVLIEAEANGLDEIGRVIDFSVLKERIGGWIDEQRKYHRQRAQDTLGGFTPIEFEAKLTEPLTLAA